LRLEEIQQKREEQARLEQRQREEQARIERAERWAEYVEILKNTHGIEEMRSGSRQTRYWLNGRPASGLPSPPDDLLSQQN
ncbi:MAG: hypothetical protein KDA84_24070, partial [Planctomycetaceae bacterium]|nr:hypothetical protein [Planctomycetaceae bacterium]